MYISIFIALGIAIVSVLYLVGSHIKNTSFGTDFFGTGSNDLGLYKDYEIGERYAAEPNLGWGVVPKNI